MKVHLAVMFDSLTEEDMEQLRRAALALTNDRQSVRVLPKADSAHWLVAEFTMRTQPQYAAVAAIDGCWAFRELNRIESAIGFPKDSFGARTRSRKKKGGRAP